MLENIMPVNIGISLFLGGFAVTTGIFAGRAIALCLRDIYEHITGGTNNEAHQKGTERDYTGNLHLRTIGHAARLQSLAQCKDQGHDHRGSLPLVSFKGID